MGLNYCPKAQASALFLRYLRLDCTCTSVSGFHGITGFSAFDVCMSSIDRCAEMNEHLATGGDNIPSKGDAVTYEVTVSNTGTTCLYRLVLTDDLDTVTVCQPSYTGKHN